MQSVQPAVLIRIGVVDHAVNLKGAVLDPVRITAWNTTQMRVLFIDAVVARVVKAQDNVALDSVNVRDEKVADRSAVRDEIGADALALDHVLATGKHSRAVAHNARDLSGREERKRSNSCKLGEHLVVNLVCLRCYIPSLAIQGRSKLEVNHEWEVCPLFTAAKQEQQGAARCCKVIRAGRPL